MQTSDTAAEQADQDDREISPDDSAFLTASYYKSHKEDDELSDVNAESEHTDMNSPQVDSHLHTYKPTLDPGKPTHFAQPPAIDINQYLNQSDEDDSSSNLVYSPNLKNELDRIPTIENENIDDIPPVNPLRYQHQYHQTPSMEPEKLEDQSRNVSSTSTVVRTSKEETSAKAARTNQSTVHNQTAAITPVPLVQPNSHRT